MVTSINSSAAITPAISTASVKKAEAVAATAAPVKTELGTKAVTSTSTSAAALNAKAFLQRQQIGAALYDRSFTLGEGINAMRRQDAIAAYASAIQAKEGGPTEKDLKVLDRKLANADKQIARLSTNERGADLDSLAAVDGRDLDIVQENLANRIKAGMKDGTLTKDEGDVLLKRQQELNDVEGKLRESDGKLTAGEQKQLLDELRKSAAAINKARTNNDGVNLTYKTYSDGIDNRQAALEKQLAAGVKAGSLTEKEVAAIKEEFVKADEIEAGLRADGRVDWKDSVKMSTALNDVEIAIYELQRNKAGVQLKDSYVDVKHADMREAQQLESLANGISNKALTDDESIELLTDQKQIQAMEERFIKGDGALDRGEYLRLQSAMNDFSLRNNELQTNKDRWTGIMTEPKSPVVTPPVIAVEPPKPPVVAVEPPVVAPPAPTVPVVAVEPPVVAPVNPAPAPTTPVVAVEPEVKPEAKPEVKAEAAPPVAEPAAEAPKPAVKPEVLANRLGEFLTGMMKETSHGVAKAHDHFVDAAKERDERHEEHGRKDDGHDDHANADNAKFRSFDAYGKVKFASERPNTGSWAKVA